MNNGTIDQTPVEHRKQYTMTPREILVKYLPYLPWVLVALVISLSVAFVKLR
jgi:hypothetical protein